MNLKKLMFSVVIPMYNKEAYIADTLNSVLTQTHDNFEVVIVNDGSTDNSLKIVQTIKDSRVKIYSKKNGGVSVARNYGISKAQGDYVAFLDADDRWVPNYLEEINKLIDKYPSCALYASAYKKVERNKTFTYGHTLPEGIVEDFFKIKLQDLVPWTSAVVVQKKVFSDLGGFPEGMIGGEDDFTWAKIAIENKVAFTPKVLAIFNEIGSAIAFRMGKVDTCKESWFDLYEEGNFYRNELVARKAIYAGIRFAHNQDQDKSKELEKLTRYTVLSKKLWWNLFFLNRLPLDIIKLLVILKARYKTVKYMASGFRKSLFSGSLQLR